MDLGLRGRQRQARFSAIGIKSQLQPCITLHACEDADTWEDACLSLFPLTMSMNV